MSLKKKMSTTFYYIYIYWISLALCEDLQIKSNESPNDKLKRKEKRSHV
jgi:hypothetical protein